MLYIYKAVCVRESLVSLRENLGVQLCGIGEKEKKSEVFFCGSRHTQGNKLGFSLGGMLGVTTTES